jgi:hypothetical protein
VAHQLWPGRIRKADGLTAEDSLTERVMEEGVLHIELLKQLVTGGSNGEHHADGGRFDKQAESLVLVDTRALREPPEDLASLVTIKSPIRERLVSKTPFAGDDIGAMSLGNKIPGPLLRRPPYSSFIAARQLESASAVRTEVAIGDGGTVVVKAVRTRGLP